MLQITLPDTDKFNEETMEFVTFKGQTLTLEHSLISLAKWESKWHVPFLSKREKTEAETIDYIRCMTLTPNVDPNVYKGINNDIIDQVNEYIKDPMTATWFSEENEKEKKKSKSSNEQVTAELIYYWMITLNIPPEYQKWHLNRLLTLIKVCNIKNAPPKKMSKRDTLARNAKLNKMRREALGSKG